MSEEFAEKMFTAFERERTSTDSGMEGTGLGLAISKSIVDLMGGKITVKTAPGQGTEMIVRLNLRAAEAADGQSENPAAEKEDLQPIDYTKKRVLLVEDNAINMEIASMILTQAGLQVETAENGQIAVGRIAAAEAGYYDAVLMDIQMPVMDGYTATRTIRSLPDPEKSRVPIIAMTANAFKEDKEAAFRAGMQVHIAKPIDVKLMMNTLDRFL